MNYFFLLGHHKLCTQHLYLNIFFFVHCKEPRGGLGTLFKHSWVTYRQFKKGPWAMKVLPRHKDPLALPLYDSTRLLCKLHIKSTCGTQVGIGEPQLRSWGCLKNTKHFAFDIVAPLGHGLFQNGTPCACNASQSCHRTKIPILGEASRKMGLWSETYTFCKVIGHARLAGGLPLNAVYAKLVLRMVSVPTPFCSES